MISFLICAVSTFFAPYPAPKIYPFYFLCKAGVTMSTYALMANPLINDYITSDTRARAFTIATLLYGLLAVLQDGVYYRYVG